MRIEKTTVVALLLASALCIAQAESFKDVHPEYAGDEGDAIIAQTNQALDRMGLDINVQVDEMRVAFIREQGSAIVEQGNTALIALQNELLPGGPVPERVAVNRPVDEIEMGAFIGGELLVVAD